MRCAILASLCLFLASCTLWDAIKPSPGLSVDTEITAGDKNQQVATGAVVGTKETTHNTNTADSIQQTYQTINESRPDYWLYLFGLVGWILPSPRQLWMTVRKLFS